MSEQPLVFVSSNPNKAIEAERILGAPLLRVDLSLPEIQAATLEEITRHKLELARTRGYQRLIVEDVSLGFDELGNFPGPYIHWLLKAAGGRGLGAIAYALRDPAALARCCVGYFDGEAIHLLLGETRGRILVQPRGESGFGWDAWFLPNGETKTYAEMDGAEKDAVSHRGRAYRQLATLLGMSAPPDEVIGNEDETEPSQASGSK
ncbi:MAG TPA: non-canonical purine NTP pyrophosphatase [Thermoanaerobaculia bacterium]|nr:non-canonical purine NTP pyrophosphatase [Thermoanaerobaculia bacterium]